ncbi:MAG: putative metal-binding motif-containing protein [Sandaracinus sp.]|nr:putative metal-binding motif-containing protein [Sandaracinus sp.]
MRGETRVFALALVAALWACGGDDAPSDGGVLTCGSDEACDDGLFCNGRERCVANVCTSTTAPCDDTCDEGTDTCEGGCPDADGDGAADATCGGTDCDDADADRYPGALEVCDLVDDDCDPTTFGDVDADGDSEVPSRCCNGERCGTDCDDDTIARRGGQIEVCDGLDNDCDDVVDELATAVPWYPDTDGDGFGDGDGVPTTSCAPVVGASLLGTDCDDSDASVSPVGTERCGGGDEDCDGLVDEGCPGVDAGVRDAGVRDGGPVDGGPDGGRPGYENAEPCTVGTLCPGLDVFEQSCFGAYGSQPICHRQCDDDTLASDDTCGADGALRRCERVAGTPSTTRVCTHPCNPIEQTGCREGNECDVFGGNDRSDGFTPHVECRGVGPRAEGESCVVGNTTSSQCAAGLVCASGTCRTRCTDTITCPVPQSCNYYDRLVLPSGRVGFCT